MQDVMLIPRGDNGILIKIVNHVLIQNVRQAHAIMLAIGVDRYQNQNHNLLIVILK